MPPEIELFLDYLNQKDFEHNTKSYYQFVLSSFFEWFEKTTGQTEVIAVTPFDLKKYREHLKGFQKAGTVNNKMLRLSIFFRWCVQSQHIAVNPAENLKRSKVAVAAPKWLTKSETYAILRMADQQIQVAKVKGTNARLNVAVRTLALLRLMLNAGLRVSEVCNLKLDDIKIMERFGVVLVRYGKGSKQREVPLNLDARKALSTWLQVRDSASVYLFPDSDGNEKMKRLAITWSMGQLGKKAGVDLNPHRLRHTFGKTLIDSGVPLNQVAMLMGHSNVATTAVYTMPGRNDLQQAVDKISWED